MKKIVFIVICIIGFLGLSSCGSTSPCGLAKAEQTKQNTQQPETTETIDVAVAE